MRFLPDAVVDHVAEVSDEPDLSGTKYRLVEPLGRGGMGSVYLAVDVELEREVAIKVTTAAPSAPGALERLRREARILARLEHPGIVPVHDLGVLPDERVFYVMKRVKGRQLDVWRATEPSRAAALRLLSGICDAVAFAHAREVIHRDLKPQNVMVGEFGEALVMDFGIAKHGEEAGTPGPERALVEAHADTLAPTGTQTAEGTVLGTPAFMSPEQARGDVAAVDARSDVYALGAILYFLMVGQPPFEGRDAAEVIERVRRGPPPRLRDRARDVPRAVASICERAMARAPEDRYASAEALGRDLRRFLDGGVPEAHRETFFERTGRFAARHQLLLWLVGVYVLVRVLLLALRGV